MAAQSLSNQLCQIGPQAIYKKKANIYQLPPCSAGVCLVQSSSFVLLDSNTQRRNSTPRYSPRSFFSQHTCRFKGCKDIFQLLGFFKKKKKPYFFAPNYLLFLSIKQFFGIYCHSLIVYSPTLLFSMIFSFFCLEVGRGGAVGKWQWTNHVLTAKAVIKCYQSIVFEYWLNQTIKTSLPDPEVTINCCNPR